MMCAMLFKRNELHMKALVFYVAKTEKQGIYYE
jgi:hypothetical protein